MKNQYGMKMAENRSIENQRIEKVYRSAHNERYLQKMAQGQLEAQERRQGYLQQENKII